MAKAEIIGASGCGDGCAGNKRVFGTVKTHECGQRSLSGAASRAEVFSNSLAGSLNVAKFAFPDYKASPTKSREGTLSLVVARTVSRNFFQPVASIRLGNSCTASTAMAMPKASVDKEGFFPRWKNEIGFTR